LTFAQALVTAFPGSEFYQKPNKNASCPENGKQDDTIYLDVRKCSSLKFIYT
jgi:hypothetical protein